MAQESNSTTLVAVFDDYAAAQQASRELMNQGIQQSAIQIESNLRTGAAGHGGSTDYQRSGQNESGFMGWFRRAFGSDNPDTETEHYAEAVRRGNALLSVAVPDAQVDSVTQMLNHMGAVDIDRRAAAWRESGYTGYDPNAQPYNHDEAARERAQYKDTNARANNTMPVVQEELEVGKRSVQRGGVRVYSRVISQPVEEKVNLREEHVRVERRPANRPVGEADMSQMRDQTIEVTEMAEVPVVNKRARVTEEVVVGKEATERTETIRDNVRHTEVRVDKLDQGTEQRTPDAAYDYGYQAASNPIYRGRSWDDVQNDLRTDYLRNNPNSKWEQVKDSIRRGWDKVTGRL